MKIHSNYLLACGFVLAFMISACKDSQAPEIPQAQSYLTVFEGRTEPMITDTTKNKVFSLKISYNDKKQPLEIVQYLGMAFGFPTFYAYRFNYNASGLVSSVDVRSWIYVHYENFRLQDYGIVRKDIFNYDSNNKLISIDVTPYQNGQSTPGYKLYSFEYYDSGKFKSLTEYFESISYKTVYDETSGRLISSPSAQQINAQGLITSTTDGWQYTYDAGNKLIKSESAVLAHKSFYAYDNANNPIKSIPLLKGLPEVLRFEYPIRLAFWNRFDNNLSSLKNTDGINESYSYTYNAANQPTKCQIKNSSTGEVLSDRYYEYFQ